MVQVSAVQDSEEEWLCEEADDQTAGGMRFLLWLNPKHRAYTGSVASQIVSAYPGQEELNSPKSRSVDDVVQQNEAEIVALVSQGEGTDGGASASEGAEADDEADKARLKTFYEEHDPNKIQKIDEILSKRPTAAERTKMWADLNEKYTGAQPASEASSSEDIAAKHAARLTNAPIGTIGAASFMLGETTFG